MRTLEGLSPDLISYGNKASGLWWLKHHGFNVPPTVLLPTNFDQKPADWESFVAYASSEIDAPSSRHQLIVRSSGIAEDSRLESGAGLYLTVPNVCSWDELAKAIDKVRNAGLSAGDRIAVIIQVQVDPTLAGALFPTDPVDGSKAVSHVEVTGGYAGQLLSGSRGGSTFQVSDAGIERISGELEVDTKYLHELCKLGREIERLQNRPCDIEWALDTTGCLWILQVRPVINAVFDHAVINRVEDDGPSSEVEPKIQLRMIAKELDIPISRAWTLRINTNSQRGDLELVSRVLSPDCLYSLVVIEPSLIDGKVIRRFTHGRKAVDSLEKILRLASVWYWKCTLIIKEILDADFTGIAMRDREGYWIEVARGHYVPKGFVETSLFRFDRKGQQVSQHIKKQKEAYQVDPQGALRQDLNESAALDPDVLRRALVIFDRIFQQLDCVIEFGVDKQGGIFLLDYVPSLEDTEISPSLALSGVVSRGFVRGRLIRVDDESHTKLSEDWHKRNLAEQQVQHGAEAHVVAARRPYISLMEYLSTHSPEKIGFVFEEVGLLSHFAIQLRERGIAAIWCDATHISECIGHYVELDAKTPDLSPRERLVRVSNPR